MAYEFVPHRQRPPDPIEGIYEGVPPGLQESLIDWITQFIQYRVYQGTLRQLSSELLVAERVLGISLGAHSFHTRLGLLQSFLRENEQHFLLLVEHYLERLDPVNDKAKAGQLAVALHQGQSVWEVVPDGRTYYLQRRVAKESVEAFEAVVSVEDRASSHLRTAWSKVYGRGSDPSAAYREAVRAVEAIAKPVILPDDKRATLGKMITALRAKPEKWVFVLRPSQATAIEHLRSTLELLWTAQLGRHGTDDDTQPLDVSLEEAEAALHLASTIAHWFRRGFVALA